MTRLCAYRFVDGVVCRSLPDALIHRHHPFKPGQELCGCGIVHAPIPYPGGIEVRDPDDEIVAHGALVHVERLDDDRVWMSITHPGGQEVHVDFFAISKRKVGMSVRDEGDTPTPIPPAEDPAR